VLHPVPAGGTVVAGGVAGVVVTAAAVVGGATVAEGKVLATVDELVVGAAWCADRAVHAATAIATVAINAVVITLKVRLFPISAGICPSLARATTR